MINWNAKQRVVMLTCYDYPSALALDKSDIDAVLVGDSVGTNVLGYHSELEVTLDDMVHHVKAVRRGLTAKPLVADLSYATYDTTDDALRHTDVLRQAGADVVKMEGGRELAPTVRAVIEKGTPVMGHIGFQPQLAQTTQRTVVGAEADDAVRLSRDAVALQDAGVCAIVLECVPEMVAKEISERLRVSTIGIGSGAFTDGQVLVISDVVGWYDLPYRFVKRYDSFFDRAVEAANRYSSDVRSGGYPERRHGFRIKKEQLEEFLGALTADHGESM